MKAARFDLIHASSVEHAVASLGENGDSYAKVLGGGQSLGPMMNLRLVQPSHLIELGAVPLMQEVSLTDDSLRLGAGVRHADIEDGKVPDSTIGLLSYVAGRIAYRAVRNRGTIGGSLAHADPSADWVSVARLLDVVLVIQGANGQRTIPAREFFVGAFTTVLGEDEILLRVDVPIFSPTARWAYCKLCRKPGEFASALSAIWVDPEKDIYRLVVGALASMPALIEGRTAFDELRRANGPELAIDTIGVKDPLEWQQQVTILRRTLQQLDRFEPDQRKFK